MTTELLTLQIKDIIASKRTTFTTRDIANELEEDVTLERVRRAMRAMGHVVEVSKGVYKAKGRAV